MATQNPNDPDPAAGFDPGRHRREIEQMEKRFRERSERHGGGPVTTSEIDTRVADEMRQFFSSSAHQLEKVVPRLQEGEAARLMQETTGEIRQKIDDFFTSADGEMAQARGAGGSPAVIAPPAEAAPPRAKKPQPEPPPAPRAPARERDAEPMKMDLKSALERLRRDGAGNAGEAPPARRPAVSPASAAPAVPVVQSVRPAAPPRRPESPPPAPPRAAPSPRQETSSQRAIAPPAQPVRGVQVPARGEAPPMAPGRAPGAAAPSSPGARAPAGNGMPSRRPALPAQSRDAGTSSSQRLRRDAEGSQAAPAARPRPPAPEAPPRAESERRREAPPAAEKPAPAAPEPAAGFESIFNEVQGIVMDTLKGSVNDTFDAARKSEPELAAAAAPPLVEPVSDVVSDAISDSIAETAGRMRREARFKRPQEDDEEEKDEAPAAPYNWGVKASPKPKGAWLVDDKESAPGEDAGGKPITTEISSLAAAPEVTGDAAGGARNYLIRKAGDEVRRFKPVLDALRESKVLTPEELGDAPATPAAAGEDDDAVSVDTFKDDRPKPEEMEQELSPMRLVEELRRLKRVTRMLVAKGIISEADLSKTGSE